MQNQAWAQLTANFPVQATEWRVIGLSEDKQQARVRAQLYASAVTERLDTILGKTGWSNAFTVMSDAVGCALTIGEVTKSSMLPLLRTVDGSTRAQDALVEAALLFGMQPPFDTEAVHTVDYDADAGAILFEPEAEPRLQQEIASEAPLAPPRVSSSAPGDKPEGQKMIDRLVERLKQDGLGFEAAKLLIDFEGYGDSPETSRELYSKLRALLKSGGEPS